MLSVCAGKGNFPSGQETCYFHLPDGLGSGMYIVGQLYHFKSKQV